MIDLSLVMGFLVGLVIFIHGIENFSKEILHAAGERFRAIFRTATKNRFFASITGALVTAVIQSSSATTVIAISLVSAGVLTFASSLGIIIGANIGTTITAQLVAFKVTAFAPYFIVAGFFVSLLGQAYKYVGRGIFYFGLVFFGLDLISQAIKPIGNSPAAIEFFANLSNPFLAILAGTIFTGLVQSSSITTGLVVIMATTGLIDLHQAIPILLGTNIGTTISALYASSRLSVFAKRAAVAHSIFNVLGIFLILPFLTPFETFVSSLGGSDAQQVANAHTIFNVGAGLIFLLLLNPYRKLVERLVKTKEQEVIISPKYLNETIPKTSKKAFRLIEKELSHLIEVVHRLFHTSFENLKKPRHDQQILIEKLEVLTDLLDEKIEKALMELSKKKLTSKEAKKVVLLVRISNLIEQLADTAKNIGEFRLESTKATSTPSPDSLESLEKIYEKMDKPFGALEDSFPKKMKDYKAMQKHLSGVNTAVSRGYSRHVKKLSEETTYAGSLFVESASLFGNAASKVGEIMHLAKDYAKLRS